MKVRIHRAQIVLYVPEPARAETEQWVALLRQNGFSVIRCTDPDTGCTVGACCIGRSGSGSENATPLPEPIIVLDGLNARQTERALTLLRPLPVLKAVRTDTNQNWTWAQLYDALCAERAQFRAATQPNSEGSNDDLAKK